MIPLQHIHPMVVHFPIVLLITAVLLDVVIVARGGNLALRQCLPLVSSAALSLGALTAALAATFGGLAADKAVAAGFPEAVFDTHETLGLTTMWIFLVLAALRLFATWRGLSLSGPRGWTLALAGVAGLGVLIVTAYFGGDLVYGLGVNVTPVKP